MTDNMSISMPEAVALLQRYSILSAAATPVADWKELKVLVLRNTAECLVIFDMECIENDGDYAALLSEFVGATKGEWRADNVESTISWETEIATLTFDSCDKHHVCKMSQDDDYVSDCFYVYLQRFADRYLNGAFRREPSTDQIAQLRYLPKEILDLLEEIDVHD